MSFFSSLQQYVSNSVASLNLGAKRFSLGRDASTDGSGASGASGGSGTATPVAAPGSPGAASVRPRTGSLGPGMTPGYYSGPKVVPSPMCSRTLSRGNLDHPPRRGPLGAAPGAQMGAQKPPPLPREKEATRAVLPCATKRPSWPECGASVSGAQEDDGNFFESFTALPWKQENRRLQAINDQEQQSDQYPPCEASMGIRPAFDIKITKKEREQLYLEVLYTIAHKIGATPGRYAHYKEDLYHYAQDAFGVSCEQHRRMAARVSEEKAPIVVLNVVVLDAEGLEAKDPNGFSDPYCMLGIQPASTQPPLSPSPQPSPSPSPLSSRGETPPASPSPRGAKGASSEWDDDRRDMLSQSTLDSPRERLRKHHSFRLSFKRRDVADGRRNQRDSISAAVPAKFIRATTVRPQTLSPRWNEKFRFDIDDVTSDTLHLDIWDHDDESSVLECVSKLNEVRGVKGLGRFFKQIAQSARSGSQDDFLGCVNIPIQDIPSTGLEEWYQLEGRSQRSSIQGRIRLKLWLSTREDRGTSEEDEDHWAEIRQQEQLYHVFVDYELGQFKGPSHTWNGELPQVALTILHQHAIQGDVTELQRSMIRWVSYSRKALIRPMDHRVLLRLLAELDQRWPTESLSRDQEEYLAEAFNIYIEHSILRVRKHRQLFPPGIKTAMHQLEFLLRCLNFISETAAFRKCCPFHKEIRGEICHALRKGALEWYEETKQACAVDTQNTLEALVNLATALTVDLQMALDCYNDLFDSTAKVAYFGIVFKQHERTLAEDVQTQVEALELQDNMGPCIGELCKQMLLMDLNETIELPENSDPGTTVFELYLAVQKFVQFRDHLLPQDRKAMPSANYHDWFAPAIARWLAVAKVRALQRVRKALELDQVAQSDSHNIISTSALDTTSCFFQIREFWRLLEWPPSGETYTFLARVIDIIGYAASLFAEITHQRLQETGFYDEVVFNITDKVAITMNSLEHVRRRLVQLPTELQVNQLLACLDRGGSENGARWHADRTALCEPLDEAIVAIDARLDAIAMHLGGQLQAPLKKNIFHLAWSPDSLPAEEAVAPLLVLLTQELGTLSQALLPTAFQRSLSAVWEVLLGLVQEQVDGNVGDKMPLFYERLHQALLILSAFMEADGEGLSSEQLQSQMYRQVDQGLTLHKTSTERLIDLYHAERLEEQLRTEASEFGVLSVRVYFNHDSLSVEVLSARDLLPLDPNGLSDPFVIVELLPHWLFPHCPEQQTAIQKKTLFPLFDECFEFTVTGEQCRTDGAMLLFTVMDHDVLTANDFEGEAFLPLRSIPGVVECATSIDNLHGLKAVDLPLLQLKNRAHPILQTLDCRTCDKLAQDFAKKQRRRLAAS